MRKTQLFDEILRLSYLSQIGFRGLLQTVAIILQITRLIQDSFRVINYRLPQYHHDEVFQVRFPAARLLVPL